MAVSAKAGRSVASTYLLGLPKGARLTDTDHAVTAADEKAVIDITNWDLPQLSVTLPPAQAGTYTLAVVAVSRPDNGEPMNFTRSTFTLNTTAESREPASASQPKRPDGAVMREAPLPPPPPATAPSNKAAPVGAITPKITAPATEASIPQAPANLPREPTPRAAPSPPSAAAARPAAVHPTENRSAAAHAALPAAPPARAALPVEPPSAVPSGPATPAPAALAPVAPAAAATASGTAEPDTKALVARAERLIKLGDISGARLLLERAASRGNPQATYLLAQTCDPKMLRSWNVQGLKPDPDRARALYAKAAQDGISDAQSLAEAKR